MDRRGNALADRLLAPHFARPGGRPGGVVGRIAGRRGESISSREPRDASGCADQRSAANTGADGAGNAETSRSQRGADGCPRAKLRRARGQTGRDAWSENAKAQQRQRRQHKGERILHGGLVAAELRVSTGCNGRARDPNFLHAAPAPGRGIV
jgi:hypothetical protein